MTSEEKKSLAIELFERVNEQVGELFTDKHGVPFAAIGVNEHQEILPIKSGRFKKLIIKIHYDTTGKALKGETLNQVCDLLQARATYDGNQRDLQLRCAYDKESNTIYIDLTNKTWQIIKITKDGWSIEESQDMPILFTRYNQLPLIEPTREYPEDIFDQFIDLLNITNKHDKILSKCYMATILISGIPKPILILFGEQGAAKTSYNEIVKDTFDPSAIKTLVIPRDNNELIQQLSHNYIAYYDNISFLRDWQSDQFCRAVTGSGSSKRELYSDDNDIIYQFKRCIGLNGINIAASRADLLDRSIIQNLNRIHPEKRLTVRELNDRLERIKPKLLGYICDLLVKVLGVIANGGIKLHSKSRMADFEEFGEIVSRCMGYEPSEFIEIYKENQRLQTEAVIEGNPVAMCIVRMMDDEVLRKHGWQGTATELFALLEEIAFKLKINTTVRLWPRGANALTYRLNEVRTNLRQNDIDISFDRQAHTGTRIIKIRITSSPSSHRHQDENQARNNRQRGDDVGDNVKGSSAGSSPKTEQIYSQNRVADDGDDRDDHIRTLLPSAYDKFIDAKTNEWEMGFEKKFMIARAYENSDRWVCKHSVACSKLSSDKPGIWAHAFNHQMAEIKEKLGVLQGLSSEMQIHELKQFNKDQLNQLLAHVEHGSQLEKQILLARDRLIDGGGRVGLD